MNNALSRPFLAVAGIALAVIVALPARAQNQFDLNAMDEGQLILNLNSTVQENVKQDTLNVMISYTAEGRDSAPLQNEVNTAIRQARDILEATDNIDYTIQQYTVYMTQPPAPVRNNSTNLPVWRAQQTIHMSSLNSEALLVVTARLQQAGLVISNMSYSLSDAVFQETSDRLMNTALMKLQERAEEVANTLGKGRADLVEVSVNDRQNFNPSMNAALMARSFDSAAMAVPVAEPGESQVSVTIQARALLSP